jgi:FRG domain-containing protein
MLDWKHLHHSFERLWSKYRSANPNPEIGIQILRHAMDPEKYSKRNVEKEVEAFRFPVDIDRDWQDITALRDAFNPLCDLGFSADTPAESVYQTAIQVRLQRLDDELNHDGAARWFYRGQRNHLWDAVPKIFRNLREATESSYDTLLEESVQRVRSIIARMIRAGLAKDDFEATAIVQHYSPELGVGTWLLDVTASPWIALFFASDGGKAGEIGTLEYIELTEWMLFSNRGESALGALRVGSPASVLRISNQEAFFLQAPHPDILRELSNRKLYFHQQEGVVFESRAFERPITRNLIYPTEDPTLTALRELPSESLEAEKLTWEPTASALRAPDSEAYIPIARALLGDEADSRPDEWKRASCFDWDELLRQLCRLHATVRAHRGELPDYVTTLHHLHRIVLYALVLGYLGVSRFLNSCYLQYCGDNLRAESAFRQCLQEASPLWAHALEDDVRWPEASGR